MMGELNEQEQWKEIAIKAVYFAVDQVIPDHELFGVTAKTYVDQVMGKMVVTLQRHVLTEQKESKSNERLASDG